MERRSSVVARLVGRHPVAADWLLSGVVTLVALGQRFGIEEGAAPARPTAVGVLFALAGSLPIAWRRRFPLGVLAVTELAVLLELLLEFGGVRGVGGVSPGLVVALYTVATSCQWRVSTRAAAAVVVVNVVVLLLLPLVGEAARGPDPIAAVLLLGGSWLVGDNVRTRRAYTAELEERAVRLEREREEQAVRAVAEERARISRELHDVVAHHVSVIAVQAGAAAEEATSDPAREALGLIQQTSRQVLAELRSLLGVLGTDGAARGLAPQPSLLEVGRLADQSRAAGLPVELVITGQPRPLPALVDLAAYRIVQEALTNTRTHAGPAHARVELRYGGDALEVRVTDDGRGGGAGWAGNGSGGRGLIGMRERVALVGGRLEVGPQPGGGFGVTAVLPLDGGP
ncbi:MAG TPA: histidine kinase [Actinomycetes bacterium]|nr:histidine kinase [Actinomycetes bacterium]